jgi:hypothetical protein
MKSVGITIPFPPHLQELMDNFNDLSFSQSSLVQETSRSIDLSKTFDKTLDISSHQLS